MSVRFKLGMDYGPQNCLPEVQLGAPMTSELIGLLQGSRATQGQLHNEKLSPAWGQPSGDAPGWLSAQLEGISTEESPLSGKHSLPCSNLRGGGGCDSCNFLSLVNPSSLRKALGRGVAHQQQSALEAVQHRLTEVLWLSKGEL